ncbi:hypothetical protein [Streptomyces beigongshangae]|nr:hypothetical protein [Streptomyces sp. REN17]
MHGSPHVQCRLLCGAEGGTRQLLDDAAGPRPVEVTLAPLPGFPEAS